MTNSTCDISLVKIYLISTDGYVFMINVNKLLTEGKLESIYNNLKNMFCKNCGKELNENQKFCTDCGTKFPNINKEEKKIRSILWITRNSNMYNWCIICMV